MVSRRKKIKLEDKSCRNKVWLIAKERRKRKRENYQRTSIRKFPQIEGHSCSDRISLVRAQHNYWNKIYCSGYCCVATDFTTRLRHSFPHVPGMLMVVSSQMIFSWEINIDSRALPRLWSVSSWEWPASMTSYQVGQFWSDAPVPELSIGLAEVSVATASQLNSSL